MKLNSGSFKKQGDESKKLPNLHGKSEFVQDRR